MSVAILGAVAIAAHPIARAERLVWTTSRLLRAIGIFRWVCRRSVIFGSPVETSKLTPGIMDRRCDT